jgi:hypothetical protein
MTVAESFWVRGHCRFFVKGLAVTTEAAGFWKVYEEARGRDVVEKALQFSINPFDKVLVVVFVGGYIPFADAVGSAGAVGAGDSWMLVEAVLEGFVF